TTGPEIWQQTGHRVDAVVCGVGSGGTLTGLGRFFQRVAPKVEMVLADPEGSILAPLVENGKKVEAGSWLGEGLGEGFISAGLRPRLRAARLCRERSRKLRRRARAIASRRYLGRLINGHAARRRTPLLPRAARGEARRDLSVRQRQ